MSDKITIALEKMDPAADEQWTADGRPAVSVVQALAEDESITRKMITDAAPFFNREAAEAQASPEAGPTEFTADGTNDEPSEDDGPRMAVDAPVAAPKEDVPSEMEAENVEAELVELNEEMAAVTEVVTKAKQELQRLRDRFDKLISWQSAHKAADPHANQREIMKAIQTSQRERVKRAEKRNAVLKMLGDEKAADAMVPSMAIENAGRKG